MVTFDGDNMVTLEMEGLASAIKDYKYAYAHISTDFTNATELAIGVDAFNDFDDLRTERAMDDDEINELKEMGVGQSIFNDNYWTIVRMK